MEFLISGILGILLIYFISSANVYRSMYKKIDEEKSIIQSEMLKLEELIQRYEKQVKIGTNTLKTNQENLEDARKDLQKAKLENHELKNRIMLLNKKNEELFAQVSAIV